MRAISTVLDVSLFLLLVGAAVATVAFASIPSVDGSTASSDPADETVETLSTSTTRVNYSVGPGLDELKLGATVDPDSPIHHRSDHGTYTSLLADAAVANASIDGDRMMAVDVPFVAAVANATIPVIRREDVGTSVRAIWSPSVGGELQGVVHVGEHPPRNGDVRTATVTVDSGVPDTRESAIEAASEDGFEGVAAELSASFVDGVFPTREMRVAVRGDYPTDVIASARYDSAADALGIDGPTVTPRSVAESNAELQAALGDRFEATLRQKYDDPVAAARDVDIGNVTVVVRTWSR